MHTAKSHCSKKVHRSVTQPQNACPMGGAPWRDCGQLLPPLMVVSKSSSGGTCGTIRKLRQAGHPPPKRFGRYWQSPSDEHALRG